MNKMIRSTLLRDFIGATFCLVMTLAVPGKKRVFMHWRGEWAMCNPGY